MWRMAWLALALLTSVLPLSAADVVAREGWVVLPTGKSYAELNVAVDAAVASKGMAVVTVASASDGAAKQGIKIAGNRVIGIFRNDFARRLLALSINAGIEAPLRMYVTEGTDGKATLSYKRPSYVFAPYIPDANGVREIATELDRAFDDIAKTAANAP